MNPVSKSLLPGVLDPVVAAIIAQLQQKVEEQEAQLARSRQTLATTEMLVLKLKEELRLERILKYGKRSEKLSDMQLQMLDLEPAVSSEEIESEITRGPLPNGSQNDTQDNKPRKRKQHPGRNELPAHLISGCHSSPRSHAGLFSHVYETTRFLAQVHLAWRPLLGTAFMDFQKTESQARQLGGQSKTAACDSVAWRPVAAIPRLTVAADVTFVPLIVSVNAAPPAAAELGIKP